jgi:urease accessory protein UreH
MGRGESWVFDSLSAETRVSLGGQLLLWEPLVLDNTGPPRGDGGVSGRMAGFECFCLVVLVGPLMEPAIQAVAQTQGRPTFQQRAAAQQGSATAANAQRAAAAGGEQRCITSLCRLLDQDGDETVGNALALKVAGRATEDVTGLLAALLAPLEKVVGVRPYYRR